MWELGTLGFCICFDSFSTYLFALFFQYIFAFYSSFCWFILASIWDPFPTISTSLAEHEFSIVFPLILIWFWLQLWCFLDTFFYSRPQPENIEKLLRSQWIFMFLHFRKTSSFSWYFSMPVLALDLNPFWYYFWHRFEFWGVRIWDDVWIHFSSCLWILHQKWISKCSQIGGGGAAGQRFFSRSRSGAPTL